MRKPAVRKLADTDLEDATAAMLRMGFTEHDRGEDQVVLKSAGRGSLATKAENIDLEASLSQRGDDTEPQVRYDTKVLLESGDGLDEAADRIARVITR
ncbi:MAG: hypothetical protein EA340_11035 [Nitriliruptor sp.]|nr:MAG: hypothetical protein EA340_11035 [Nitriliruptor sp.]